MKTPSKSPIEARPGVLTGILLRRLSVSLEFPICRNSLLLIGISLAGSLSVTRADSTYQPLASGPFTQNWFDTGLITTNDDWSGVPGIIGYRGDDLTMVTGT